MLGSLVLAPYQRHFVGLVAAWSGARNETSAPAYLVSRSPAPTILVPQALRVLMPVATVLQLPGKARCRLEARPIGFP
jgi:hypothetical protein